MSAQAWWRWVDAVRLDLRLLVPILAANLAGMLFGWFYYWDVGQFDPSSPYFESPVLWPLVADSPNAVLLFFVAAAAWRWGGWRHPALDALAFCLNVYVGLWTTLLFLSYPERMGTFDWGSTNSILFVTHMGMPAQALLLVPRMREDRWSWTGTAAVLAFLVAYVAVDYWGPHIHPAPFLHPDDGALHRGSPWLMAAAAALWLGVTHPARTLFRRAR